MLPSSYTLPRPRRRCIYTLTNDGERRVRKNEFYLQQTPNYRGYTERIFRALFHEEPMTIAEISYHTGIDKRSVNGVITYNIMAGYVEKQRQRQQLV